MKVVRKENGVEPQRERAKAGGRTAKISIIVPQGPHSSLTLPLSHSPSPTLLVL